MLGALGGVGNKGDDSIMRVARLALALSPAAMSVAMPVGMCVVMTTMPAAALDGDALRGRRIAQAKCASCHLIDNATRGRAKTSPNPSAPPFQVIALRYEPSDLEESLTEGIVVGHGENADADMPEFALTAREAQALTAWLRHLRGR